MMKSLLSAAALLILLTPALAQPVEQPNNQDQPAAAIQPAAEVAGQTQAEALAAAAQADAQGAEEHYPVTQPAAGEAPLARQAEAQEPEAQPANAQQPYPQDAAQQAPQRSEAPPASQPSDEGQPDSMSPNVAAQSDDAAPLEPRPIPRRALELPPAIRPRAEAAAYPVYREQQQFSMGARLLSSKEVERRFSTPLGKRYIVVEVGFFPADAQIVKLRPDDFTLRIGSDNQAFFPATPGDIARALSNNSGSGPRQGSFYPSLGVGYGGGRWGRGISTGVGVGVGTGPYPRRGGMAANRRVMEDELRDKSFHGGNLTQPTAGYLYFPRTEKHPNYNLEFTRNGETLSLALPAPTN